MREKLLAAATALFTRKGYAATSVQEIVDAAGVTKPALYYHFRSKEGIFLGLMHQASAKLEGLLKESLSTRGTARERLTSLCQNLMTVHEENLDVVRVMNSIYYGPSEGAPDFDFHSFHERFRAVVERLCEEGLKSGEFKRGRREDIAWGVLGILNITLETQLCHPEKSPGRDGMTRMLRLFFDGLKRKALALIAASAILCSSPLAVLAAPYTVKPGDTLYGIARTQLGDQAAWRAIARLNNLAPPYALQAGAVLELPGEKNAVGASSSLATSPVIGENDDDLWQVEIDPRTDVGVAGSRVTPLSRTQEAPSSKVSPTPTGGGVTSEPAAASAAPDRDAYEILLEPVDAARLIPDTVPPGATPLWPAELRPSAVLAGARRLTMSEAVEVGLAQAPDVRAAEAGIRALEAQIGVVFSAALPRVTVSGTARRYETGKSISPVTALDEGTAAADATVSQALYTFGRIPSALKAAAAERAAAQAALDEARLGVKYRVEAAFLGLLLARERLSVAREAVEVAEALMIRARARLSAGVGTRFDVTRTEAERASALARIVESQAQVEVAREALAVAMGLPPASAIDVTGDLGSSARPIEPSSAERIAIESRPDLASLRQRIVSSDAQVQYQRAQSYPSIDAFASANYTRHDYIRPGSFSPWHDASYGLYGVTVTVPIFDGFRSRQAARQQTAISDSLKAQYDQAANNAVREVRAVYYDLGAAREKLAARQAAVVSNEEALRMAQLSYSAGRAALLDVIQATYLLSEARKAEAEARHDYRLGLCRLVRSTGTGTVIEGGVTP